MNEMIFGGGGGRLVGAVRSLDRQVIRRSTPLHVHFPANAFRTKLYLFNE